MKPGNTAFVLIDVQGRLAELMHGRQSLFDNLRRLVQGMQALQVPILWCEQNPERMGVTIPELASLLKGLHPISKIAFSCWGDAAFVRHFEALGRRHVLLAGIEAHVCVYQTARDMLARGYDVHVVADAVSSRTAENRLTGLEAARALGACLCSVEMALFDLMATAEHPAFKRVLKIVK